ncbi:MAG: endonuclease/exonuclease/phosphatase family protein [Chitinophagales bacterium]|nr:endonuclease/exonuclease/phosphatase family protein [Chitinophagales bacterium]
MFNENLLVATWNIRDFGSNKFGHGHRLPESYFYIGEILSAFDVIAVQEVSDDLTTFQKLMYIMGPDWDYLLTDVTEGAPGNGERMAFIYDTKRVSFKKIAGQIVLPKGSEVEDSQFARTPYLVAFQAGWFKFQLCTVHIYYGADTGNALKKRVGEIAAIAQFFGKRAKRKEENLILLGDFNIVSPTHQTMEALEQNGFIIPDHIKNKPVTTNMGKTKYYDQIAYMEKKGEVLFAANDNSSGAYNYYDKVFSDEQYEYFKPEILKIIMGKMSDLQTVLNNTTSATKQKSTQKAIDDLRSMAGDDKELRKYYEKKWRTFQMSDHLPMWVELKINFSNNYLNIVKAEAGD